MTEDTKQFMFGLDQCRKAGGMIWHGKLPKQIIELYDIKEINTIRDGYWITGVYVKTQPQYEAYKPDWINNEETK